MDIRGFLFIKAMRRNLEIDIGFLLIVTLMFWINYKNRLVI